VQLHAFLHDGAIMHDIGTPGGNQSFAYGINDSAQAVGASEYVVNAPQTHAILYSGGGMVDLNSLIDPTSSWSLTPATAIDVSGQIVGEGINPSGQMDAFLLTPIPEPVSLGLLVVGLVPMLMRRAKVI
jgi:probable HAF family extracellular repeat protein